MLDSADRMWKEEHSGKTTFIIDNLPVTVQLDKRDITLNVSFLSHQRNLRFVPKHSVLSLVQSPAPSYGFEFNINKSSPRTFLNTKFWFITIQKGCYNIFTLLQSHSC